MVEITQAQAQVVSDWDMAKRQGFNQAIAALEQPMPELVEVALKAQNQTRWSAARNLKGDNVYQPTPQDAMKAALAAAAKHLKGEG